MSVSVKKVVGRTLLGLLVLVVAFAAFNYSYFQRLRPGGLKIYETTPPALPADLPSPAILVFSKTNGFRHAEAIPAANTLLANMAKAKGWGFFQTENGATFTPDILARFDAVVFNNVSGDVFTPAQQAALKDYIGNGGGYVGIHGAGGDGAYLWRWYVDDVIGAQFKGHPINPHIQPATIKVEDPQHPAMVGLPASWQRADEWYSFAKAPRKPGYHILATLDESTYKPRTFFGRDLAMGDDHPVAWWHCVGKGRVLYSALGHTAESYAEPLYQQMLQGAIGWAMRGQACTDTAVPNPIAPLQTAKN